MKLRSSKRFLPYSIHLAVVGASLLTASVLSAQPVTVEPVGGVGNNFANPGWGSAGSDLLRKAPVAYNDGISTVAFPADISSRGISNFLNNQAVPNDTSEDLYTVDINSLSDFGSAFGQFVDHDMDLTPDGGASFPIPVARQDPIGSNGIIPFTRSITDPATGAGTGVPAQQVNVDSSYLDLSQVYGSSQAVSDALRTFSGGLLKTSPGNMLPYNNSTYFTADQITALNMGNDAQMVDSTQLFAAGDVRANENIELTSLETLFVRNHNLIAQQFAAANPSWTDEQIYQEARKLNIAVYQNVIYTQFLPALLGSTAIPAYTGYNSTTNASIANEFSTVAYRFGHSLINNDIGRTGNDGQASSPIIPLAEDFFDPNLLNPSGVVDPFTGLTSTDIDPILKGDASCNGQKMDLLAVSSIRNLLFGDGAGGDDLIARDVWRSRDNGIAGYNPYRKAYGLPTVTTFAQILNIPSNSSPAAKTAATKTENAFAHSYPGGVSTVDAFEGGSAETPVSGSDVGPTFQAVMVDQFRRLRDGDRFFYLNETFNSAETAVLTAESTLSEIIESNTGLTNLQANACVFKASISGTVTVATGKGSNTSTVTMELEDVNGDLLASVKLPAKGGAYTFNQLSGPAANSALAPGVSATGTYNVVMLIKTTSTAYPSSIQITSGDTNVTGINFSVPL